MKKTIKLISMLLALLMVFGCFAACKKVSDNTEKTALDAFNELKTNVEKLFFTDYGKHPTADKLANSDKVQSIDVMSALEEVLESGKTVEGNMSVAIDKLNLGGEDMLAQLGGKLNLSGNLLMKDELVNVGLDGSLAGINIGADLYSDGNAMLIDFPLALTKPLYITSTALEEIIAEAKGEGSDDTIEYGFSNAFTMGFNFGSSIAAWAEENLTEDKLQHIASLFKGLIKEEYLTGEKVVVPEFKGDYITTDIEAECITLKIDINVWKEMLTAIDTTVLTDNTVKELIVSFAQLILDSGMVPEEQLDGADAHAIYNKICTEFKELIEDTKDEDDSEILIKRYFVEGYGVKFDVVVNAEGKEQLNLSCWRVYNDTAAQFGIKLNADGAVDLNVIGGANETEKKATVDAKFYSESYDIDDNGQASSAKALALELNGNFSYKDGTLKGDGTLDVKDANTTVTFNCDINETEGTLDVVAKEGDEEVANVKMTGKTEGEAKNYNLDVTVKDGEVTIKVNADATVTETKTETGGTVRVELAIASEDAIDFEGTISVGYDLDSKAEVKSPSDDGAFTFNGMADVKYLKDILTPMFQSLVGGSEPDNGNDTDTDIGGDYSDDISGDDISGDYSGDISTGGSIITGAVDEAIVGSWEFVSEDPEESVAFTFNADGTGSAEMMGLQVDIQFSAEGGDISMVWLYNGVTVTTIDDGVYAVDGDTLVITVEGDPLTLTKK